MGAAAGVKAADRRGSCGRKNLGFSYQKARFVSDHVDEDKRREWLTQRWPAIVALAQEQNAYVLLGDEGSFSPVGNAELHTWARRGQQPTVKPLASARATRCLA